MWIQAEAEKGDPESQYKLAWLYHIGSHGIEKNMETAKKCRFRASATFTRECSQSPHLARTHAPGVGALLFSFPRTWNRVRKGGGAAPPRGAVAPGKAQLTG